MIAPVAVGADPDLEQRRLVVLDRQVAGRRERLDSRAGPDEREPERELDPALPAGARAVDEAVPHRAGLRLLHARAEVLAHVLHRGGGDLVGESHPLELLLCFVRARAREERGRVGGLAEAAEPGGGERRGLADHAVGSLRAERELEPDLAVLTRRRLRQLERAGGGRPRVVVGVAAEEADVVRPGVARSVLGGGLEADQHRLALAREDDGLVALHAPEVRQVENVVGRADDQRVEAFFRHQRTHALELRVVAGPAHEIVTVQARSGHRHVRACPVASTAREAGQKAPPRVGVWVGAEARPVTTGRAREVVRRAPPATRRPGCAARRSARSRPPSRRPA